MSIKILCITERVDNNQYYHSMGPYMLNISPRGFKLKTSIMFLEGLILIWWIIRYMLFVLELGYFSVSSEKSTMFQ
jgi:hypothetical protein